MAYKSTEPIDLRCTDLSTDIEATIALLLGELDQNANRKPPSTHLFEPQTSQVTR